MKLLIAAVAATVVLSGCDQMKPETCWKDRTKTQTMAAFGATVETSQQDQLQRTLEPMGLWINGISTSTNLDGFSSISVDQSAATCAFTLHYDVTTPKKKLANSGVVRFNLRMSENGPIPEVNEDDVLRVIAGLH